MSFTNKMLHIFHSVFAPRLPGHLRKATWGPGGQGRGLRETGWGEGGEWWMFCFSMQGAETDRGGGSWGKVFLLFFQNGGSTLGPTPASSLPGCVCVCVCVFTRTCRAKIARESRAVKRF